MKTITHLFLATILCLCFTLPSGAQSIFDKAENWLVSHHATLSYGPQFSWYKYSHMQVVQPAHDRNLNILYVEGQQTDNFEALKRGELSTAQSKLSFSAELSEKYSLQLFTAHLNYDAILDKKYKARGTWNGTSITSEILLSDYFNLLQHSNGLNFWNLGVQRKWDIIDKDKVDWSFAMMPNAGAVLTATQAEILNNGNIEYYDPLNKLSGFCLGGELSTKATFYHHWQLGLNFNMFQSYLLKARLDDEAYLSQRIRGSHYGALIAYRL